jgi:hypothetical protein
MRVAIPQAASPLTDNSKRGYVPMDASIGGRCRTACSCWNSNRHAILAFACVRAIMAAGVRMRRSTKCILAKNNLKVNIVEFGRKLGFLGTKFAPSASILVLMAF